ncbi:MAG: hypothetical protein ACK4NA_12865 [Alphaproteobacteria bacterium]
MLAVGSPGVSRPADASGYAGGGSAAFESLIASQRPGQYLVEIAAYKGGQARSGGLSTLADVPLADLPRSSGVSIGQITLRYADRHWVGAPVIDAVSPDGALANAFYEGRIVAPLLMSRQMPLLPEEPRRVQRQFGAIEIANGDGGLDTVLQSYAVDGRRVRVLFGPLMGRYGDFAVIADTLATGWEGDELSVRLALRDQSYALDLPLQSNLYGGGGGADGNAELEGKPKPLAFGLVRNATPVLVDPANLIFQVHDGAIEAIDDVFDRGAALANSGDDAGDYAALVALSVAAGEYATCLSAGLFKLGSSPDGLITCDLRGDADPDYADTLDLIALRILRDRAGLPSSVIVASTFAGVATLGGSLGFYLPHTASPTTSEVMDTLLASVGGWWGASRDGRLRAGRLTDPGPRSPNLYLGIYDILSIEPAPAPVPRWRQRATYAPNWTAQRGEDLAASVTPARRQFLTELERAVAAADTVVKVRHLQALDPSPLPTLFDSAADAQSIVDYLLALHSVDRQAFFVRVKRIGYQADLQTVARVTYPRYGLQNGKNFAVIGIEENAQAEETILKVWG